MFLSIFNERSTSRKKRSVEHLETVNEWSSFEILEQTKIVFLHASPPTIFIIKFVIVFTNVSQRSNIGDFRKVDCSSKKNEFLPGKPDSLTKIMLITLFSFFTRKTGKFFSYVSHFLIAT